FLVAEIFGDGKASQRDSQTSSRRLGHLAVDQRGFRLGQILEVDNAGLLELMPEVVALAGSLADAGEHGEAAVLGRDVVDQLLNHDGLADAGAAEQANLSALQERKDEIDNFDAGLEHLLGGRLLVERGSLPVNRHVDLGVDGAELVYRLTKHVEHAAQRRTAHGNSDAGAGVGRLHAANHALGGGHGDAAHAAFAEVLLHFENDVERLRDIEAVAGDADRLVDRRHLCLVELHVNGRSADADHFANVLFCHKSSKKLQLNPYSAAAPETISMISLVIAA